MKPKVLVADDEARTLRAMEAMLVPAGYEVILAENGTEAIAKAIKNSPDVILLDVMMPDLDGFEVASQLRANERTKDIPIVMVTALGEVKDRVKALESGADDFLTKPVDKTELRTRVKTLVEKSERIRRLTVQKKRSPVPMLALIVAAIVLSVCTILIAINVPATETAALVERYEVGFQAGLKEGSPKVEKEIEYRDVVREVVKEVVVKKQIEQREFSSKEELDKWLAEDDTNKHVYLFADAKGVLRQSDKYDCDDYALQLQSRAAESGFLTSVTIITKQGGPHMINLMTIGNDIYYVEPQTDEVWFYTHLDKP